MTIFPKENKSQQNGRLAKLCFQAQHPQNWDSTATDGDGDVGIDFLINLISGANEKIGAFHVQLKGSDQSEDGSSAKLNKEGTQYSVPLKYSTLNYYLGNGSPLVS